MWCGPCGARCGIRSRVSCLQAPCLNSLAPALDGLELLERLPAIGTVVDRAAQGGPERVLEGGVARAAIGAGRHDRHGQQICLRDRWSADGHQRWRGEAAGAQLLAAFGTYPIRGPRHREADPNLDLIRQLEPTQPLPHLVAHDVDGRAAHEGWQQVHGEALTPSGGGLEGEAADHAEVHDADGRDLGVRNFVESRPDDGLAWIGGGYHVAPRSEAATIVNSPWSQRNASVRRVLPSSAATVRSSDVGPGRPRPASTGETCSSQRLRRVAIGSGSSPPRTSSSSPGTGLKTANASAHSMRSAAARRSLAASLPARRRSHVSRCIRWYRSSRRILAASWASGSWDERASASRRTASAVS